MPRLYQNSEVKKIFIYSLFTLKRTLKKRVLINYRYRYLIPVAITENNH